MSNEDLHELAGLQASVFAAELRQSADLDSLLPYLADFYPHYMTAGNRKLGVVKRLRQRSQSGLELLFADGLRSAQGKVTEPNNPHQLKVLYLEKCWSMPFYG